MSSALDHAGTPTGTPRDHILEDEIVVLEEEIEILEEEIEANGKHPTHPTAIVRVDNSDDGETIRIRAPFRFTVGEVIDRMYKKFGLAHEAGDRLSTQPGGEDVFPLRDDTIRDYLRKHGDKAHIHWVFAGDTGGA